MSDLEKRLEEAEARAKKWEGLYSQSTIRRTLLEAAEEAGAYHAPQLLPFLEPSAKLVEIDGQHVVRISATDEHGREVHHTPSQAIAYLKQQKDHENLFKSATPKPAQEAPATGKIDVRKLTHAQYREIREKNPEVFGLAPKPR